MKLNRSYILITFFVAVTLLGCATSQLKTISSWINKEKLAPDHYKSIFIIVLTGNLKIKETLENDLAAAAEAKGIKAFKSVTVFGPFSGKESIPSKDLILKKSHEIGCEAIFTVALLKKEVQSIYVPPSTTTYTAMTAYPVYGGYGAFSSYYTNAAVVYDPGYSQTDKTYYVESSLFDLKTEALMMSVETKAANPEVIEKSGKQYTESLVTEIQKLKTGAK